MRQDQRRPGRPRDPAVKARDEAIYQLIADGTCSRSTLATASGHNHSAVYLSCKRLQALRLIRQCLGPTGNVIWVIADGTPCP